MSSDRVTIFDTTLRDGEQSPGCSMNTDEKLRVAEALCDLGVDVIEAGFPVASPGDFDAVSKIAERFGDRATICGLARCRDGDIDAAADAVAKGERGRVHVFLATSAIHREHKLRMSTEQIVERAVARAFSGPKERVDGRGVQPRRRLPHRTGISSAKSWRRRSTPGPPPSTSPTPSATPRRSSILRVIKMLTESVPNIGKAVISTHCHDDLGMAVANTLAGFGSGRARQVECTINGIGERAGNAALEEVVMALRTRARPLRADTPASTPASGSPRRAVWSAA